VRRLLPILAVLFVAGAAQGADTALTSATTVHLATVDEGKKLLGARDDYVNTLGDFERAVRFRTARRPTAEEYTALAAAQVRPWTQAETAKMETLLASLRKNIARLGLTLPLPREVTIIKTTGVEEHDASYTRGAAIIMSQTMVDLPMDKLEYRVTHEFFHVLCRGAPATRDALYATIGFSACGQVPMPADLAARRVTNPDAPKDDYCIEVTAGGQPTHVVMVIAFMKYPFDPQKVTNMFFNVGVQLLAVEKKEDKWVPRLKDGKPQLFAFGDVPSFFDKVGKNTGYLLQPEEILAESWTMLVMGLKAPTPAILEGIRKVLTKKPEPAAEKGAPEFSGTCCLLSP
jgi:hypothetical protein